jgi:adenine-specific DNA-methyltransferase
MFVGPSGYARRVRPKVDPLRPLSSPELLIGAAIGLGAENVGPISRAERDVVASSRRQTPSTRVLNGLREQITAGLDPLGGAFCELRSPEARRPMGATYTPSEIVESMADWAVCAGKPARAIDPGSGSARFALALGRRLPSVQLFAVEIDPLAALIARANLNTAGLASRSFVLLEDYRSLRIPEVDGQTVYLGNPPYVRHHQISPEWKSWLVETARARRLSASQLAGLHVYFFLATAQWAKVGDRGALITSSEWLDVVRDGWCFDG